MIKYLHPAVCLNWKMAIVWYSAKQGCTADSTMKIEYVAAPKLLKKHVWFHQFLKDLEVVLNLDSLLTLLCDNGDVVANSKEPIYYRKSTHIERKCNIFKSL